MRRPGTSRASARSRRPGSCRRPARDDRRRLGDPLRRRRSRRDRARPAAGARCRPRVDRARQALHDDRHRHRAGPHRRGRRQRDRGLDPGPGGRCASACRPSGRRPCPSASPSSPPATAAPLLADPVRTTPIQPWHLANGAVFEDVGQWKRPRYFPRGGESMDEAVLRECAAARSGVGRDGRHDPGQDRHPGAGRGDLPRPGLHEHVLDPQGRVVPVRRHVPGRRDGLRRRRDVPASADDRFHMTTTTGNAAAVLDHLEEWLQTEWPDLRVHATSVTEQWVTVAVVGPRAREVVGRAVPDLDVSNEAFPFMTWREAVIAGTPGRVFRISFSGELAFELNVPTLARPRAVGGGHGRRRAVRDHALRHRGDARPARREGLPDHRPGDGRHGHAPGPRHGGPCSTKKDFIGRRSHRRPDAAAAGPQAARRPAAGRPGRASCPRAPSSWRPMRTSARRRSRCSAT